MYFLDYVIDSPDTLLKIVGYILYLIHFIGLLAGIVIAFLLLSTLARALNGLMFKNTYTSIATLIGIPLTLYILYYYIFYPVWIPVVGIIIYIVLIIVGYSYDEYLEWRIFDSMETTAKEVKKSLLTEEAD